MAYGSRYYYNRAFDFEERDEDAEEMSKGPFKVLHSNLEIAAAVDGKLPGFYSFGEKKVANTAAYQFITDGRFSTLKLSTPKIPQSFLTAIVSYFRQDLTKEAIVKVTYNKVLRRFFLRYPNMEETKAEKGYIIYNFSRWIQRDEITVLDIHSHNTMPAFFSATDDADEYIPGLYGVIGNLDSEQPTMAFRFSGWGIEKSLDMSELFAEEVSSDAV